MSVNLAVFFPMTIFEHMHMIVKLLGVMMFENCV